MRHPKCQEWQERSELVLAGGPATLSKHWSRYPLGLAPSVFVKGDGAYVTCPDGETYVDTVAALGPVILGHSNPAVNLAIYDQVDKLSSSTLTTPLETEVAEQLCRLIPGAEQVRFALNGKDANDAAVRLARYITGHDHVIYVGYAGGFTDYLSTTDKRGGILPGVADYNHQVPWRDWDALDGVLAQMECHLEPGDLAAIILEVPPEYTFVSPGDTQEAVNRYKKTAQAHGALFILDEVVTGLRYAMGGAQEYYGVTADLITMSKALGNGCPIAAVLGNKYVMQPFTNGEVFCSTTFGANPIGLAAAKATLDELQSRTHGRASLQAWGEKVHGWLCSAFEVAALPVRVKGNFARMVLEWLELPGVATPAELHTLWLQETVKRGALFGVPIFPMCCYNPSVMTAIEEASQGAITVIQEALRSGTIAETLEVPVIGSVFERYAQRT